MAAFILLVQASAAQDAAVEDPSQEAPPAVAGESEGEASAPGPTILEQAIQIAIERFGGRAAGSETVVLDGGKRVHEIRVLGDGGNVRTVRIDPETGAIL